MPPSFNDNEHGAVSMPAEPDSYGQAALLLVESMLHTLVEANVFTTSHAVSIVETAMEVKVDVAEALGESTITMEQSLELLRKIAFSLRGGR